MQKVSVASLHICCAIFAVFFISIIARRFASASANCIMKIVRVILDKMCFLNHRAATAKPKSVDTHIAEYIRPARVETRAFECFKATIVVFPLGFQVVVIPDPASVDWTDNWHGHCIRYAAQATVTSESLFHGLTSKDARKTTTQTAFCTANVSSLIDPEINIFLGALIKCLKWIQLRRHG